MGEIILSLVTRLPHPCFTSNKNMEANWRMTCLKKGLMVTAKYQPLSMLTENTVFYCLAFLAWCLPLPEKHLTLQSDQAAWSTTSTPRYSKHHCTLYSLCPECPHPSLTLATHLRFGLQIFFSRKPFLSPSRHSLLPLGSRRILCMPPW